MRDRAIKCVMDVRPAWVTVETVLKAFDGEKLAAQDLSIGLHDRDRLFVAAMMQAASVAPDVVWVLLEDGLTQTNGYRAITKGDLVDLLEYVGVRLPGGLPAQVTVFRGGDPNGLSWSLSRDVAQEFADRVGSSVIEKVVSVSEIAFYSNCREEQEVILWEALEEFA